MSFTPDELQSLNSIVEQKLLNQRHELEHLLDQRIQADRRNFDQRLQLLQQRWQQDLTRRLSEQQQHIQDGFRQRLQSQHALSIQHLQRQQAQKETQRQQQVEDFVENSLAAQLLAFEQLIHQNQQSYTAEPTPIYMSEATGDFQAIEFQTEIPWEDLVALIEKVLDERLTLLHETLRNDLKETERTLAIQLHALRDTLTLRQKSLYNEKIPESLGSMQEVFASIEQLERLIESMQVAMTANSALISNRLYHHQQLPPERAHTTNQALLHKTPPEEDGQLFFAKKSETE